MKNNVILKIKNDEYEFIYDIYKTPIEAAKKNNLRISCIENSNRRYKDKRKSGKEFIFVRFNMGEDYENVN